MAFPTVGGFFGKKCFFCFFSTWGVWKRRTVALGRLWVVSGPARAEGERLGAVSAGRSEPAPVALAWRPAGRLEGPEPSEAIFAYVG